MTVYTNSYRYRYLDYWTAFFVMRTLTCVANKNYSDPIRIKDNELILLNTRADVRKKLVYKKTWGQ